MTRRTRVVELSRLANGKTAAANDEDLLDVDVLLGFYHSAGEVRLRVRGRLCGARARAGGGRREEPFLAQPGDGRLGLCAEEAILGASSQRPQLGGGYWDAATMTEDGRSTARLGHGRQHGSGQGVAGGSVTGSRFRVSGSTPVPSWSSIDSVAGRPRPLWVLCSGGRKREQSMGFVTKSGSRLPQGHKKERSAVVGSDKR